MDKLENRTTYANTQRVFKQSLVARPPEAGSHSFEVLHNH